MDGKPTPGLCADCRHARVVTTARANYFLCRLAQRDLRLPKYPPLPVLRCSGYRSSQEKQK